MLEETFEPADSLVRIDDVPTAARARSRSPTRARSSRCASPRRERRGSCPAPPTRCRVAARRGRSVPAFRFASSATERKYSACRRCTSSASGAASSSSDRVLPDRVEHPQATAAPAADEVLDDERLESVEIGVADRLSRLEREASPEDRELPEELLLLRLEQLVAPLDRRAQRSLPGRRVARARREQRQPPVEAREQLVGIQQRDPCRCELDRERKPVEPPADLTDGSRVVGIPGRPPARARRRGPRHRRRATARPGTGCSESTCSGSRLVTRTTVFGVPARSDEIVGAASTTCSKLSTRTSSRLFATYSIRPSSAPTEAPIARSTRAGSRSACNGTQKTPSGNCSTASAASWSARRVLPLPPGPVSVSRRCSRTSSPASASSRSRPTSGFGWIGRFVR